LLFCAFLLVWGCRGQDPGPGPRVFTCFCVPGAMSARSQDAGVGEPGSRGRGARIRRPGGQDPEARGSGSGGRGARIRRPGSQDLEARGPRSAGGQDPEARGPRSGGQGPGSDDKIQHSGIAGPGPWGRRTRIPRPSSQEAQGPGASGQGSPNPSNRGLQAAECQWPRIQAPGSGHQAFSFSSEFFGL